MSADGCLLSGMVQGFGVMERIALSHAGKCTDLGDLRLPSARKPAEGDGTRLRGFFRACQSRTHGFVIHNRWRSIAQCSMRPFAVVEALDVTDDGHLCRIARGIGMITDKFVLQRREEALRECIPEKGHGACWMLRPEAKRTSRAMGERGGIVRTLSGTRKTLLQARHPGESWDPVPPGL